MKVFSTQESEGCSQESIILVPMKLDRLGLCLEFPEGFYPMEEEKQCRIYPWEGRPEVIWENNCGVQITGQMTGQKMRNGEIYNAALAVRELTESTFLKYRISPVYLDERGGLPVGWFQMEMTDRESEHIKAVSVISEHMILVTFTYPSEQSLKWRSIIRHSFGTWRA